MTGLDVTKETSVNTPNLVADQHKVGVVTNLAGDSVVELPFQNKIDPLSGYANMEDTYLDNFFQRPIKIAEFSWTIGSALFQVLDPYALYISNSVVAEKLSNYHLFRCDLVVTIRINGTPFHYGRAYAAYTPFLGVRDEVDSSYSFLPAATQLEMDLLRNTQKHPIIYIDPAKQSELSMRIPFFYPADYIRLPGPPVPSLGNLTIQDIVNLNAATATSTTDVDIAVFVHAENVSLTVPTAWTLQAGPNEDPDNDDMKRRPNNSNNSEQKPNFNISAPLRSASSFLSKFKNIPFVGDYATAGAMVTSSVSSAASLLGYSKPVNINDVNTIKREIFDDSATTDSKSNVRVLSIGEKAQVSVTPMSIGLENTIEHMSLHNIVERESLVRLIPWTQAQAAGTPLTNIMVSPTYALTATRLAGAGETIQMSAIAYGSFPFKNWGGSIKYRLSVVASQYHRGRLRITYDPRDNTQDVNYNKQFNMIVDLEKAKDLVFTVSMAQDRPYLTIERPGELLYPIDAYNTQSMNGILSISVLNSLTSPDTTKDVNILLFMSAAEDFNVFGFKDPHDPNGCVQEICGVDASNDPTYAGGFPAYWHYQSGPYEDDALLNAQENAINFVGDVNSKFYEDRCIINYGDPIVSFRDLLKRWEYHELFRESIGTMSGNQYIVSQLWRPNMPRLAGAGRTNGATGGYYNFATTRYGLACNSTLLSYLYFGYAAWRGSIRYRYVSEHGGIPGLTLNKDQIMYVSRFSTPKDSTDCTNWQSTSIITYASATPLLSMGQQLFRQPHGLEGMQLTDVRNQNGVEVQVPYYNPYKFCIASVHEMVGLQEDGSDQQFHNFTAIIAHPSDNLNGDTIQYSSHVSTGDDFGFYWFVCAPQLSYFTTAP